MTAYHSLPQTLCNPAGRTDSDECVLGSGRVKVRRFGVGEERVRPPDLIQHLITNTQLVLAGVVKVESGVVPVLAEVEIQRKVLSVATTNTYISTSMLSVVRLCIAANRIAVTEKN